MGEQFFGEIVGQTLQIGIEKVDALVFFRQTRGRFDAFAVHHFASDVKIKVEIDAALDQFGHEEIHAIQLFGIEFARNRDARTADCKRFPDAARRGVAFKMMNARRIEAKFRQARGDFGRFAFGRKTPAKLRLTPQKRSVRPPPSTKCSPRVLTKPSLPAGASFKLDTSVAVALLSNGGRANGNIRSGTAVGVGTGRGVGTKVGRGVGRGGATTIGGVIWPREVSGVPRLGVGFFGAAETTVAKKSRPISQRK